MTRQMSIAAGPAPSVWNVIPSPVWALFAAIASIGFATENPMLTVASIMTVPFLMMLLWRPGETPVLLVAVGYQWAQVSAKVFQADLAGLPVEALSLTPTVVEATWMGLGALLVLAVGMHVGMRRLAPVDPRKPAVEAMFFSPDRAFILYLVGTVAAMAIERVAWSAGGFTQALLAAVEIKWVAFFLLGYTVLRHKSRYGLFAIAVVAEFVSGLGFFAGFKTVIFITMLVFFTVRFELSTKTISYGAIAVLALALFGAVWTSVKGEYRSFLTEGETRQGATIDRTSQLVGLWDRVTALSFEDVTMAFDPMLSRLSYVEYFAASMDYVPNVLPHESGTLLANAFRHVTMPRALFPNKPALTSDSELTMQYTGLHMASDESATSISIGYVGETYIDWGGLLMYVPIFLIGLAWGTMYWYFMSRAPSVIVGYAFSTAVLINAYQFEMTLLKLMGTLIMKSVVLALVLHFLGKRVSLWLSKGRTEGFAAVDPAPAGGRSFAPGVG